LPLPSYTRRNWDSQLENDLPDSRVRWCMDHELVYVGGRQRQHVYCASCGMRAGVIRPEWFAHVFYLCEPCCEKYGAIEGTVEVPEAAVR